MRNPGFVAVERVKGERSTLRIRLHAWHPSYLAFLVRGARKLGIPLWHPRVWFVIATAWLRAIFGVRHG